MIALLVLASLMTPALMLAGCQRAVPLPLTGSSPTAGSIPASIASSTVSPPHAGRIVFAAADGTVRSVRSDGQDEHVIARPAGGTAGSGFPGALTWPVWSPDASSLLLSQVAPDGGRRLRASLLVVSVTEDAEPVVIYRDDPSSFGIGTGVPHFALWSPDATQVAVVAGSGSGPFTVFVDPAARRPPDVFVAGEPMFLAWAPGSRHLLVHHGETLRLVEFDSNGARTGGSSRIGHASFEYLAPQFAPSDGRYAYAERTEAGSLVRIGRLGDDGSTPLVESTVQIAFAWSPDGSRIAIAEGEEERIFERLAVVDVATGARRELFTRPIHSFWWSPDGSRIAVASLAAGGLDAIVWSVIDLATLQETILGLNVPTDEFQFMQTFFDQYAQSHQIWSPDSRAIVVFGAMVDAGEGGDATEPARGQTDAPEGRSRTWVLNADGRKPPISVGDGYIGAWSPR